MACQILPQVRPGLPDAAIAVLLSWRFETTASAPKAAQICPCFLNLRQLTQGLFGVTSQGHPPAVKPHFAAVDSLGQGRVFCGAIGQIPLNHIGILRQPSADIFGRNDPHHRHFIRAKGQDFLALLAKFTPKTCATQPRSAFERASQPDRARGPALRPALPKPRCLLRRNRPKRPAFTCGPEIIPSSASTRPIKPKPKGAFVHLGLGSNAARIAITRNCAQDFSPSPAKTDATRRRMAPPHASVT